MDWLLLSAVDGAQCGRFPSCFREHGENREHKDADLPSTLKIMINIKIGYE